MHHDRAALKQIAKACRGKACRDWTQEETVAACCCWLLDRPPSNRRMGPQGDDLGLVFRLRPDLPPGSSDILLLTLKVIEQMEYLRRSGTAAS